MSLKSDSSLSLSAATTDFLKNLTILFILVIKRLMISSFSMIFEGTRLSKCAKHGKCLSAPNESTIAFLILAALSETTATTLSFFIFHYKIRSNNFSLK